MARISKSERMRRLRLGDLLRCCRHRFGAVLPDDTAGYTHLIELLLPISLGPEPARIMQNVIEVMAAWSERDETLIASILTMPERVRRPTAKAIGKRLNVTNAERERGRLWTIHPIDMTDRQMAEQSKAKKRARDERRRQQRGAKSRQAWLAASLTKQKPWQAEEISRRTWYRRRQKTGGTGPRQTKLLNGERTPVPRQHEQAATSKVARQAKCAD
jgi:hypothetical protein